MNPINHVHVNVADLGAALAELDRVWLLRTSFTSETMAVISVEPILLVVDSAEADAETIIGFASEDCDRDTAAAVSRGAVVLEGPFDAPWGPRVSYLRGPGKITFEFEQQRKRPGR
jgi:hypothetical protein